MPIPTVKVWNTTWVEGNSTFVDMVINTSQQTNTTPGTLIIIAIALVIFFTLKMKGQPTPTVVAATAFAHCILCIISYPLSMISGVHFLASLILLPIAAFILYTQNT